MRVQICFVVYTKIEKRVGTAKHCFYLIDRDARCATAYALTNIIVWG